MRPALDLPTCALPVNCCKAEAGEVRLTPELAGQIVRHDGVHADVRVNGDGEAEHKVRSLLHEAALHRTKACGNSRRESVLRPTVLVRHHDIAYRVVERRVAGTNTRGALALAMMATGVAPARGAKVSASVLSSERSAGKPPGTAAVTRELTCKRIARILVRLVELSASSVSCGGTERAGVTQPG